MKDQMLNLRGHLEITDLLKRKDFKHPVKEVERSLGSKPPKIILDHQQKPSPQSFLSKLLNFKNLQKTEDIYFFMKLPILHV